jgi:hypothetical protein
LERITPADITALKQDVFSSLHCALPGVVESFDADSQTAAIRPGARGMPLLRDVPVFMPVSFEITAGNPCLVIFADCDIDAWFEGGDPADPVSGRMHSLSDAFAFVGFRRRESA